MLLLGVSFLLFEGNQGIRREGVFEKGDYFGEYLR